MYIIERKWSSQFPPLRTCAGKSAFAIHVHALCYSCLVCRYIRDLQITYLHMHKIQTCAIYARKRWDCNMMEEYI